VDVAEVGLEREEPVEPVLAEGPDGLDQLAVTVAGHGYGPVGGVGVLDLHVLEVGTQDRIPLGERADADLDEVRRVPRHSKLR